MNKILKYIFISFSGLLIATTAYAQIVPLDARSDIPADSFVLPGSINGLFANTSAVNAYFLNVSPGSTLPANQRLSAYIDLRSVPVNYAGNPAYPLTLVCVMPVIDGHAENIGVNIHGFFIAQVLYLQPPVQFRAPDYFYYQAGETLCVPRSNFVGDEGVVSLPLPNNITDGTHTFGLSVLVAPAGSQSGQYCLNDGIYCARNPGYKQVFSPITATIARTPPPQLIFAASKTSVYSGETVQLQWSGVNLLSCTAGGNWSGSKGIVGPETTAPITSAKTYTLSCLGTDGSTITSQVRVGVYTGAVPVVSLSVAPDLISQDAYATVSATVSGPVTTCYYNEAAHYNGAQQWSVNNYFTPPTLNRTSVFPVPSDGSFFGVFCEGPGGWGMDRILKFPNTSGDSGPQVTLFANPGTVQSGGSSVVTWTSQNSYSCSSYYATDANSGYTFNLPVSGIRTLTNLTQNPTEFQISCGDMDYSDTKSVLIGVSNNIPPVAAAGADQTIVLPTNSATLDGRSSHDSDGTIASYLWTKVSGPSSGLISTANQSTTNITGLSAGTYVYQLTVTDDRGATGVDTIAILVLDQQPSCGSAIFSQPSATPPSANLCSTGSASGVSSNPPTWDWTCTYNSANIACHAAQLTAQDGTCNPATNNKKIASIPNEAARCSVGVSTNFQTTATGWKWKCDNSANGGGVSIMCNATRLQVDFTEH